MAKLPEPIIESVVVTREDGCEEKEKEFCSIIAKAIRKASLIKEKAEIDVEEIATEKKEDIEYKEDN